jgi:hypothetical protein
MELLPALPVATGPILQVNLIKVKEIAVLGMLDGSLIKTAPSAVKAQSIA